MKKAVKSTTSSNIQPLRQGACTTLNGKTQLEYAVGRDEAGGLFLRVAASDSTGHFDKSYVPWPQVLEALQSVHPVTSIPLRDVYKGKSVNSSGFLLAVLLKEGVVERLPDRTKQYALAADAESYPRRLLSGGGKAAKKPSGGSKSRASTRDAAAAPADVPRAKARKPRSKKVPA